MANLVTRIQQQQQQQHYLNYFEYIYKDIERKR